MLVLLSVIARENLYGTAFIEQHCTGFETIKNELLAIDIEDCAQRCDVPLKDIEKVARDYANAKTACVRIDLGIQHSMNSTLNGYL